MKKIITLLLIGTLLFLTSGCDGNTSEKKTSDVNSISPNKEVESVEQEAENNAEEKKNNNLYSQETGFSEFYFTGTDLDGNEMDKSLFQGKKLTMINVWGTFCPPCIKELPDLDALHREFSQRGFQVVGVTVDTVSGNSTNVDLLKNIVNKRGVTYPVVIPSEETQKEYLVNIQGVPATFFVDEEGKVISDMFIGALPKNEYQGLIEDFLSQAE